MTDANNPFGSYPPPSANQGYPPPAGFSPTPYDVSGGRPMNGFGVTALVCGILAVLFGLVPFLFFFAVPIGIVAVVFGLLGRGRAKRGEATNSGQALAGTICGSVGIVLSLAWLVLVVGLAASHSGSSSTGTCVPVPASPGSTAFPTGGSC